MKWSSITCKATRDGNVHIVYTVTAALVQDPTKSHNLNSDFRPHHGPTNHTITGYCVDDDSERFLGIPDKCSTGHELVMPYDRILNKPKLTSCERSSRKLRHDYYAKHLLDR